MPAAKTSKLKELFGLDLRSLALFRVGLGVLILLDLGLRSMALRAHYTDFGVLPRSAQIDLFDEPWFPSLHLATGSTLGQAVLFGLAALFAVGLLIGYRTRLMTVLSWIMLVSLQNRNGMILNAGDIYFRVLLFWGMFLPLGACFSVDRALRRPDLDPQAQTPHLFVSAASAALIFQIIYVYFFAGWIKYYEPAWQSGMGVYYALLVEQFTTSFGKYVSQYKELLKFSSPWVLIAEAFGAFLVFVPYRNAIFRLIAIVLFCGFHVANAACFSIGLFSLIGCVAWSVFLPTWFWDQLLARAKKKLVIYYDQECRICIQILGLIRTLLIVPHSEAKPAQSDPSYLSDMQKENSWIVVDDKGQRHFRFDALLTVFGASWIAFPLEKLLRIPPFFQVGTSFYKWFADHRTSAARVIPDFHERSLIYGRSVYAQSVSVLLLAYITWWNLGMLPRSTIAMPESWEAPGYLLRLDQHWLMFAKPILDDGWWIIPAELDDGTQVDLFNHGEPLIWKKPDLVSETFEIDRWRKYMFTLFQEGNEGYLLNYGQYLCRSWNEFREGPNILRTFKVIFMREDIQADGHKLPAKQDVLWTHSCFDQEDQTVK